MKKTFAQLIQEAANKSLPVVDGVQVSRETHEANAAVLRKLLTYGVESSRIPISVAEALGSGDASVLFKAVIDDVLVRPLEPTPVASTRLARTLNVDAKSFTFPVMGAIAAGEISESGDYPEATPGFSENGLELKTRKYGMVIPINEDVIADSQWDVLALFLEAGRNAMSRLKEENCFRELSNNAQVVYDNGYPSGSLVNKLQAQTRGLATNGTYNGTLSFRDIVTMIGVLVSNGYNPTDFTVHPMSWTIFVQDPIIRFLMLQNGQAAQTQVGAAAIGGNLPWAFQTNVSPIVPFNGADTNDMLITNSATGVTTISGATTECYITDNQHSLIILQKESLSAEEMQDPYRDIRRLKIKERYAAGMLEAGMGAVVAKNVVIAENVEPVYTVRTMTN